MSNAKYFIPLFALILLVPSSLVYAESTGVDDKTNNENPHTLGDTTGPVGNTLLNITTLESYKIDPEITKEMLQVFPGEKELTVDFGVAYDELNLIDFGIEEHINPEHVEFLEDLEITVFGKHGDALTISLHPSQKEQLQDVAEQLNNMYPNVDIKVSISPGLIYHDTTTQTSTVNRAIPNGGTNSITDTITITNHAKLNSISVSIVVNHEDHDEMYMTLTSPDGTVMKIFNRERNHADGLQTFTYTSSTNTDLAKLIGKDIKGTWSLNVRDAYSGSDTGVLKSWSLSFDTTSITSTDGTNTNGNETTDENFIEQFFNLLFGDTTCNSLSDDCIPKVGGQYISYIGRDDVERHGSIGLGGLNTTDGLEGFIIAGHSPGHGLIGKLISHELV